MGETFPPRPPRRHRPPALIVPGLAPCLVSPAARARLPLCQLCQLCCSHCPASPCSPARAHLPALNRTASRCHSTAPTAPTVARGSGGTSSRGSKRASTPYFRCYSPINMSFKQARPRQARQCSRRTPYLRHNCAMIARFSACQNAPYQHLFQPARTHHSYAFFAYENAPYECISSSLVGML